MTDTHVIYIAGFGRSGTTLLDRLLCSSLKLPSVGEIVVWAQGFAENRLCSCGQHFSTCVFWRDVVRVAPASFDGGRADATRRYYEHALRSWHMWKLFTAHRRREVLVEAPFWYESAVGEVYDALATVAKNRIVVDSSKNPTYLWLLANAPGIRLHVVHCVRDPRAVAFSWQRRLHDPGEGPGGYMNIISPGRSAGLWDLWNTATVVVCRALEIPRHLIRYEDLVQAPEQVVSDLVMSLDLPAFSLARDQTSAHATSHLISGNPMRFGEFRVRYDDEWHRSLSTRDQLIVTLATLPLLRRFGYPLLVPRHG